MDNTPKCPACKGTGVLEPATTEAAPPGPELAEFVRAWVMIERYGPGDALVMLGESAWDEVFVAAVEVFEAELRDLEAGDETAWRKSNS